MHYSFFLLPILLTFVACEDRRPDNVGLPEALPGEVAEPSTVQAPEADVRVVALWPRTGLRSVPGPEGRWLSPLVVGETATWLGDSLVLTEGDRTRTWLRLQLSDGTQAWVQANLVARSAAPAVVARFAPVHTRPDLMTAGSQSLRLLEIVAVVQEIPDGWAEIRSQEMRVRGWVRSEALSREPLDLVVASRYWRVLGGPDSLRNDELLAIIEDPALATSGVRSLVADSLTARMPESDPP